MARVRMAEKKEKSYCTKKKARERRKKILDLSKSSCCCELKPKRTLKNPVRRSRIEDLPNELIQKIAQYLSLKDLLAFGRTTKFYHDLIKNTASVWSKVSFEMLWPNRKSANYFERAAEYGNIECLAKLSFVSLYIYNFKTSMKKSMKISLENAEKAIKYFSKIDQLISPHVPLTWMFIRPPWANPGSERKCLKECLLMKLEESCSTDKVNVPCLYNIGKTYLIKEELDNHDTKSCKYFEKAAEKGCIYSKYELYKKRVASSDYRSTDSGLKLESVRKLQEISMRGHIHATVDLCCLYASELPGNISRKSASDHVKKIMKQCKPSGIHRIATSGSTKINENMRCILVNWMHEVCDVKNIHSEALHMAIDCLDQFLLTRYVHRKQLQLIGISCVVLASKVFSCNTPNLLTIRESAWLTDNTYEYNEVVKMLAEIIGALRGQLVRMNSIHYTKILCAFAEFDDYNSHFVHYVVDSSLQFCEFGRMKPSLIAASATFLTRIIAKYGEAWPSRMVEFTGFDVKDLANCASLLHSKCLLDNSDITDGEHRICGARDRYSSLDFLEVAKRQVPDLATVRASIEDLEPRLRCTQTNGLLEFCFKEERNVLDLKGEIPANSSFLFGYDGDEEDNLDQNQTQEDLSFFCGREQKRPSLNNCASENGSEETSKSYPKHYILDYDSGSDETRPAVQVNSCVCKPSKFDLNSKANIESSMENLSEVFSAACSCSSSCKSNSSGQQATEVLREANKQHQSQKDTRKKTADVHVQKADKDKKQSTMKLRSSSKRCTDKKEEVRGVSSNENATNDRRRRPPKRPGSTRPLVETKKYSKEPWKI